MSRRRIPNPPPARVSQRERTHQDNNNDNKRKDLTPNDLFIAAGQNKSAPMPYNVNPRIKVALYPNLLSTQPPYVKHAMGYALSSRRQQSHCSRFPDMEMGMWEPPEIS